MLMSSGLFDDRTSMRTACEADGFDIVGIAVGLEDGWVEGKAVVGTEDGTRDG